MGGQRRHRLGRCFCRSEGSGRQRCGWLGVMVGLVAVQAFFSLWALGVMKILWFEDWRLFYSDCEPNAEARHCSMQTCFDFRLCPTNRDMFRFSIDPLRSSLYKTFDDSDEYAQLKQAMVSHPWYTPDLDQACVFFPEIDTLCVISACGGVKFEYKGDMGPWTVADQLTKLARWNGGLNHMVIEIHDREQLRYDIDKAIGVKSGFASEWYRTGFDISFPLYPKKMVNETAVRLTHRAGNFTRRSSKYLLTFKGGNNRRHTLRPTVRSALHNPRQGIVLVHSSSQVWDYDDLLMNTKFALIVQGNGLHSYRLAEAMRANAIPVILADSYVLPFSEKIPWQEIAVFVPQNQWASIPSILARIDSDHLAQMRERLAAVYDAHFASPAQMVDTVLQIVRGRIYSHGFIGT